MADFVAFGDPNRFEIAIRPRRQRDPRGDWPDGYGWSMGDLRLTVGGHLLTGNLRGAVRQSFASWYLLPLFEWIAARWVPLLHEEEFGWAETSPAAAAVVIPRVFAETLGRDDAAAMRRLEAAQLWAERHSLRTAATGGLMPDLYVRRFLDRIELSWSDLPPAFAPPDFRFVARPGYASCAVNDVAEPLWDAMEFFADARLWPERDAEDERRRRALVEAIEALRRLTVVDLAAARVAPRVLSAALDALGDRAEPLFASEWTPDVPAITVFAPAVAMFGGMQPDLSQADVRAVAAIVLAAEGRAESPALVALAPRSRDLERQPAEREGHALAERLIDQLALTRGATWVDVRAIVAELGIEVSDLTLETQSIRGIGIAGRGVGATIVVNHSSVYNVNEHSRRFTLAHELCHLIHDRGHARSVGITSGPWAPAAVEKRANAFAAMLLMPRDLVITAFSAAGALDDPVAVASVADTLGVNRRALIEHLYNIHLIDEVARERLRGVSLH